MGSVNFQLDGALSNGQEQRIALGLSIAVTFTAITPSVRTAPSGTALVVRLQKQSGGAPTDYIEATIVAGQLVGLVAVGSIAIPAGASSQIYLRVVTASAAQNLTLIAQFGEATGTRAILSWNIDGDAPIDAEWMRMAGPAVGYQIRAAAVTPRTPPPTVAAHLAFAFLDSAGNPVNGGLTVTLAASSGAYSVAWPTGAPPLALPGGCTVVVTVTDLVDTDMVGALIVLELEAPGLGDALCSLDDLRLALGIDTSDADAALTLAIAGASEMIRGLTRRQLSLSRTITAERHVRAGGVPIGRLPLREWPILSIAELRDGDGDVIDPSEYVVEAETGLLRSLSGAVWADLEVDYVTGFAGGIPPDLRLAAVLQAEYLFKQLEPGGGRLGNRGPAQAAVGSPGYLTDDWVPQALTLARRYARAA